MGSKVEDHVCAKDELVMPGSVVEGSLSVRVVIAKLGPYGNELVWPPGDADGMFGILCGKPSPGTHLVVKVFIPHREERARGNPEHRVVHDCPLRRITVLNRKRAALKRY